jgi:hypothetical protein
MCYYIAIGRVCIESMFLEGVQTNAFKRLSNSKWQFWTQKLMAKQFEKKK